MLFPHGMLAMQLFRLFSGQQGKIVLYGLVFLQPELFMQPIPGCFHASYAETGCARNFTGVVVQPDKQADAQFLFRKRGVLFFQEREKTAVGFGKLHAELLLGDACIDHFPAVVKQGCFLCLFDIQ